VCSRTRTRPSRAVEDASTFAVLPASGGLCEAGGGVWAQVGWPNRVRRACYCQAHRRCHRHADRLGSFGFAKVRRRRRCLLPRELARAARCRPRRVARSERYGRRRGCVRRQAQRGGRPSLRRRLLARQCGGRVPRGGRGTTSMASTQHRACVAAAQDAIWKGTAMARETSQGAWHAHRDAHRSIQCQVNGAEGCGHGCCRLHRGCRAKRLLCPT
jgi:hypothetical protein